MTGTESAPLIGLIVNPVAGLGGRVGLKGSDGLTTQRLAIKMGGKGRGVDRTILTMKRLSREKNHFRILTCQGAMGEQAVNAVGLSAHAVMPVHSMGQSSEVDTIAAAQWMSDSGVKLILFAGGDGTARNILDAIGNRTPVLGIPAGVKIQSAVFAINPTAAAEMVIRFINGEINQCLPSEVMDLDEDELRQQRVSARLHGYLNIPVDRCLTQGAKSRSRSSEQSAACSIAEEFIGSMCPQTLYVIGPGMTTAAVKEKLGINGSLIGVDLVKQGELVCRDASEQEILNALAAHPGSRQLVITCIGGQGFLLGRGNPQISPEVLNEIGVDRITVLATSNKLTALGGRPLLVDTGSPQLDTLLSGYISVITGFKERLIYRVASSLT